jgi:hypothetical protein
MSTIISFKTLQNIATSQGWADRRQNHLRALQDAIEARVRSAAVATELAEIQTLRTLVDGAVAKAATTAPKSLEGLLQAIVRLDVRIAEKRAERRAAKEELARRRAIQKSRGPKRGGR